VSPHSLAWRQHALGEAICGNPPPLSRRQGNEVKRNRHGKHASGARGQAHGGKFSLSANVRFPPKADLRSAFDPKLTLAEPPFDPS
jgi:hypothetical protein